MAAPKRAPKAASASRTPKGARAKAVVEYTKARGKAPPKSWTATQIAERMPRATSAVAPAARPAPVPARIPTPVPVTMPSTVGGVVSKGVLSRIASSNALHMAGRVAGATARGSLIGLGIQTGLQVAVGAYRDGWRGAGLGAVDALTFGFGNAAYNRRFGERKVDIDRDLKEGVTNSTINGVATAAATIKGARLLGAGTGLTVAMTAAGIGASVVQAAVMRKFLSFPPETDKDRSDTRKAHRNIEIMKSGKRYSERLKDKSDSAGNKEVAGAVIKGVGYAVGFSGGLGHSPKTIAAGAGMVITGSAMQSMGRRERVGLNRKAIAVDYFARRGRLDNTSGVPYVVGQNASIAFAKANRDFSARLQMPPTKALEPRAGEFYDRTRRDPRSGKTIHEKVRNPNAR